MGSHRRVLWSVPWSLAVVGLAVPMVGSGFVGWPFVAGWLVVLAVTWWVRPIGGADRTARLAVGAFTVGALLPLGTVGGFYLIPSVVLWLALVATEPRPRPRAGQSLPRQPPHMQGTSDLARYRMRFDLPTRSPLAETRLGVAAPRGNPTVHPMAE